jgi:putative amide transporter protein
MEVLSEAVAMIALVLLYVGAVLVINGVWILGAASAQPVPARAEGAAVESARREFLILGNREVAVMNIFTGILGFLVAMFSVLRAKPGSAGIPDIEFGAFVLLFAFTYLYVGVNQFLGADGRALGWYCLFVAVTALPTAAITLASSQGHPWLVWLGIDWAAWAVLWFLYFLLLAVQRPIGRLTGIVTILQGVLTAWIPAYLLLAGYLPLT